MTNGTSPVALTGLSVGVTAVAAGDSHNLALRNGDVYAWGDNRDGELGDGTQTKHLTPERIDPTHLHNITSINAQSNGDHVVATLATTPEPAGLSMIAWPPACCSPASPSGAKAGCLNKAKAAATVSKN